MTTDDRPAELADACATVAAATPADAVGGVPARYVAAPQSTAEAATLLAAAARLGLTVVPRGSGSRLDWGGRPASCDLIVDTGRLDQVVEHAAGDLVVTVQAGVRLDQLATVLASAGQRLALDPPPAPGSAAGTVGGVIATGAAGPLRYRYGTPRDLLIGMTVVRADGTIARSGGKVVKNVAGYDLGKLFAGSCGTLGLITEATFRLHPLPEKSSWISAAWADAAPAAAAVQAIAASPLTPAAIELGWPSAAAPITVSVLLEGDEASVGERAGRLEDLLTRGAAAVTERHGPAQADADRGPAGDVAAADPSRVARPPSADRGPAGTLVRVAFWAGQLEAVLGSIRSAAAANGLDPAIGGSAAAGVLDVVLPEDASAGAAAGFVSAVRASVQAAGADRLPPAAGSAVVVCAPPAVRQAVDMWGPVPSLPLMRAVKQQFDPDHRMAPGRFAGGI